MAILVNFFAGNPDAIRRCLDSGDWPPDVPASRCHGWVGFKFGIMPEQAFDALIGSATRLSNVEAFRFQECVSGQVARDGESFHGTVNGRFIEFFATFPDQLIHDLSARWTNDLGTLYESAFPPQPLRKRPWLDRLGSGFQAVIFGAIMFPLLAACCLIPSFRRERAMNKKRLATRKIPAPPTNDELISSLIRLCASARHRGEPLTYTWNI